MFRSLRFIYFVPSSTSGVRQTFGKFSNICQPGLNFCIPFVQSINIVSHRIQEQRFKLEAKTQDDVFVKLELSVQSEIKVEDTHKAFFTLTDPESQLTSFIENVVRSEVPNMTLKELFQQQTRISDNITTALSARMQEFGYTIRSSQITNVDPDYQVKSAMNAIVAAERLKEAAQHDAEAKYIKEVKQAEADRKRKQLQGEGVAQQRAAILNGYEESIQTLAQNCCINPKEVIDFVKFTQRMDAYEAIGTSANCKTLFLDLDSSTDSGMLQALEAQKTTS